MLRVLSKLPAMSLAADIVFKKDPIDSNIGCGADHFDEDGAFARALFEKVTLKGGRQDVTIAARLTIIIDL
ncbi:MAG: hypothetical protein R3293_03680 [Candidatus Promineifilaceae bacterium]|nr:hypothetical protein [Candidatus Promineifilaceae bacterium]